MATVSTVGNGAAMPLIPPNAEASKGAGVGIPEGGGVGGVTGLGVGGSWGTVVGDGRLGGFLVLVTRRNSSLLLFIHSAVDDAVVPLYFLKCFRQNSLFPNL